MKTYVSYVIQDEKGHRHKLEMITTQSPSYTFSPDPLVSDVMEWSEQKKRKS